MLSSSDNILFIASRVRYILSIAYYSISSIYSSFCLFRPYIMSRAAAAFNNCLSYFTNLAFPSFLGASLVIKNDDPTEAYY